MWQNSKNFLYENHQYKPGVQTVVRLIDNDIDFINRISAIHSIVDNDLKLDSLTLFDPLPIIKSFWKFSGVPISLFVTI